METNRQKKIGALLQNDLVDILQGEIRKNGINNLIIVPDDVLAYLPFELLVQEKPPC